ncbi:MAG: phenylacetate-CoA oxygenase subunit PaaC [Chloroflexi bacterium]|nr:phenylacetate-CoA oxygenase subunit PaaC [Chloroflexota bacterium]
MNDTQKQALAAYLIALGDDELILGHRDSEWAGHAPILEEDIAFANLALDEIGHAVVWYELASDATGENPETHPNHLAYFRDVHDFRCVQMVELPKGDWAYTIVRQYLFDVAERIRLTALAQSNYPPLAEAAGKIKGEELYHLRHSAAWVKRLGLGTAESNIRMQHALNELWALAHQLFMPLPGENDLTPDDIVPVSANLLPEWEAVVRTAFAEADLTPPAANTSPSRDRSVHTPYLIDLVTEMQKVARLDPDATW